MIATRTSEIDLEIAAINVVKVANFNIKFFCLFVIVKCLFLNNRCYL